MSTYEYNHTANMGMQLCEPLRFASAEVFFKPHHIDSIGARVFVIVDLPEGHYSMNITPDDARRYADALKIAACHAESMTQKAERRRNQEKVKC